MAKQLVGIKYDGEPSLRNIASVCWKDGETEGDWTTAEAREAVMTGEMIYVPGPLGMAVLSICDYPDGHEGISSVRINELPPEVLAKLPLQ
jgi:hypothetical protein